LIAPPGGKEEFSLGTGRRMGNLLKPFNGTEEPSNRRAGLPMF
jgi:hypothetical protein